MNIISTFLIYGGGPGSGCNPDVGKCGRPETGKKEKNTLKFYHGTVLPSAKMILSEGLQQDKSQKFKVGGFMGVFETRDGFIYMAKKESLAKAYAKFRSDLAKAEPGSTVEMKRPVGTTNAGYNAFFKVENSPKYREGEPAVIELTVPKDVAQNLEKDSADDGGWRTTGIIPKEYVTGIETMNGDKWVKQTPEKFLGIEQLELFPKRTRKAKVAAAAMTKVYLAYYGDLAALQHHLKQG